MKNISRKEFFRISIPGIAAVVPPFSILRRPNFALQEIDTALEEKLVEGNDRNVVQYLKTVNNLENISSYRSLTRAFACFTAAYFHPRSKYFNANDLAPKFEMVLDVLISLQYPNGTLDAGGNRKSPPDTGFLLESLCPSAVLLKKNDDQRLKTVKDKLFGFILNAGEGIRKGGVHTPNHRWVVSSILAQLYNLFGDEKYVTRVDQWLSEGIYLNEDGNYPERSRNYSSVETRSFITIGHLLNRQELLDIARKNLIANYYYMEPNGQLVTLDSRRQDQYQTRSMGMFYYHYRFLANHFNDPFFGAIVKQIEKLESQHFDSRVVSGGLIQFMESPILQKPITSLGALPTDFTRVFTQSSLVRIRKNNLSASIFGGTDKPLIVASGRSTNPTFFSMMKGAAILKHVRISTGFFNTGYFRADGITIDGNKYILREKKEAYYFHPLPDYKKNPEGDYKLTESEDRRFWSKMDFPSRPKEKLTLNIEVVIIDNNGQFTLEMTVNGQENVSITVDINFNSEGSLDGVEAGQEEGDYFFKDEYVKFKVGNDTIQVGPGKKEHQNTKGLDGEVYSTHFGSIKGEGKHLFLTGSTPFKHTITIN